MYEVKTPIGGFEKLQHVQVDPFDIYLSTIELTPDESISIINSQYLTNINIEFSQDFLNDLEINDDTNYDIYFATVIQNPIKDSRVNLGAPIILNNDKKTIGQFVTKDNGLFDMPKLKELNTLSMR